MPAELVGCSLALRAGRFDEVLDRVAAAGVAFDKEYADRPETRQQLEVFCRAYAGVTLCYLQRFEEAAAHLRPAVADLGGLRLGSRLDLLFVEALRALGLASLRLGRLDDCMEYTGRVLDHVGDNSRFYVDARQIRRVQAALDRNACQCKLGQLDAALDGVDRVIAAAKAIRAASLHSTALANRVLILRRLGRLDQAVIAGGRALSFLRRDGGRRDIDAILIAVDSYAGALIELSRASEAVWAWRFAVTAAERAVKRSTNRFVLADAVVNLANILNEAGRPVEALEQLDKGEHLLKVACDDQPQDRDRMLVFASTVRCEILERTGDRQGALALIDQTLALSDHVFGPEDVPPYILQLREARQRLA